MKPRLFLSLFAALILIIPFGISVGVASADTACDPAFVNQVGDEIIVSPTGVDDTANLQCAFDEAPPEATVRLLPGTFYTNQIVVHDFHGRFMGAGDSLTTIVNLPQMYVAPLIDEKIPPSADEPWPVLISFIGGDISVYDLAIHIAGDEPTTLWKVDPAGSGTTRLLSAVVIFGFGEVNVEISEISMSGEFVDHPKYMINLALGVLAYGRPEGHIGSFHVLRSNFTAITGAIDMMYFTNTDVLISHNRFYGDVIGTWVERFTDSNFVFSHNSLNGGIGLWIATPVPGEDTGNSYLVKNNTFEVDWGIIIDTNYGEGNQCLLLGNNVQTTVELGIGLGATVHGCTVVGGSTKTNVWDEGYDNILVGVNNMGTGVGPTIQEMLKPMR